MASRTHQFANPHLDRMRRYRAGLEHSTSLGEAIRWRARLASEARTALFSGAITFEQWREVNDYITAITHERGPQWTTQQ